MNNNNNNLSTKNYNVKRNDRHKEYRFNINYKPIIKSDYMDLLATDLEKHIISLLNNKGGELIIGIKKGNIIYGMPSEIKDSYSLLVSNILVSKIKPITTGLVSFYYDDNERLIIKVKEGIRKPYYVMHKLSTNLNKSQILEEEMKEKEVNKA